jgi:hypothetical protein
VFVSGWPEERSFEVQSAWISGWDFTVVFDDELVGGLMRNWMSYTRDSPRAKALRRFSTKTGR